MNYIGMENFQTGVLAASSPSSGTCAVQNVRTDGPTEEDEEFAVAFAVRLCRRGSFSTSSCIRRAFGHDEGRHSWNFFFYSDSIFLCTSLAS